LLNNFDRTPKALIKESGVYGLGIFLSRGLWIFLTPILTRVFDPKEFGELDLLQAITGICSILMSLQMASSLLRYYPEGENREAMLSTYLLTQLGVGFCFLIFVSFFGLPLAQRFLNFGTYWMILAAAFTVPAGIIYSHALTLVRARREVFFASTTIFINTSACVLLIFLLVVVLEWGLSGIFMGKAISDILSAAFVIISYRGLYGFTFSWEMLKKFLKFGVPLLPDGILNSIKAHGAKAFLLVFASIADVGLLAVASRIAMIVNLGLSSFRQAFLPYAMSIAKLPDAPKSYSDVFRIYVFGTLILLLGVVMFSREIILILAGSSYLPAQWLIGLISAATIIGGLPYIFNIGLLLAEKTIYYSVGVFISTLVVVSAGWMLISRYGLLGAPLSNLLASIILSLVTLYFSHKFYPIPYNLKLLTVFIIVLCGIAALGVTIVVVLPLLIRVFVFAIPTFIVLMNNDFRMLFVRNSLRKMA